MKNSTTDAINSMLASAFGGSLLAGAWLGMPGYVGGCIAGLFLGFAARQQP